MAKSKKDNQTLNYSAELRALKDKEPGSLYLLYGPEDYLREQYLTELKKRCLPDGDDGFSYRRFDGPELDFNELDEAVNALPFLSEHCFVELRDVDINKLKEPERYIKILSDIPDYCTVCFVQNAQYEPDGRLKLIKTIRERGKELKFTAQPQGMLIDWIIRRFRALGKTVELDAAQRLIFVSGRIMSGLIPEIEKTAAYTKGDRVTVREVDEIANHIPEARIFEMTDYISQKKFNTAVSVLAELLMDKNNEPIPMLAMLGVQMRRLYTARIALEKDLGLKYIMEACGLRYDFIARDLLNSARGFTLRQLRDAVRLCAETDYKMKSSGEDDAVLLKDVVLRIAAGC